MSYILEALKKSQQERELGRVPTLDANLYPPQTAGARTHPWSLLAVGLAMLAVIIALYAALRGEPLPTTPEREPDRPAPGTLSETGSVAKASTAGQAGHEGADTAERDASATPPPMPSAPPPPRRIPPPEPRTAVDARIPPRPTGPPIPEDVRADIEAFKHEVLGAPKAAPARPAANVPPEQLRLPPEIEARVPAFLMTVHVYDEDPSKRFVLINALKTREGERTREGLVLEQILPNGAVLSFQGHRFFRHR